jgi:hypothetical protein
MFVNLKRIAHLPFNPVQTYVLTVLWFSSKKLLLLFLHKSVEICQNNKEQLVCLKHKRLIILWMQRYNKFRPKRRLVLNPNFTKNFEREPQIA